MTKRRAWICPYCEKHVKKEVTTCSRCKMFIKAELDGEWSRDEEERLVHHAS